MSKTDDVLRELTRNPVHMVASLFAAVLIVTIAAVASCGKTPEAVAKVGKARPATKPAAVTATIEKPHLSNVPSVIAVIGDRGTLEDWHRLDEDARIKVCSYLALKLHPDDSSYAWQVRAMWYFFTFDDVAKRPAAQQFTFVAVAVVNDADFADYLASQAQAPTPE